MNRVQKAKLAEIGVTTERYFIDVTDTTPPVWGLSIKRDGAEVAVIEDTPREHGGDGRFHLRRHRTRPGMQSPPDRGAYRLQRLAIAGWLQAQYR